MEINVKQSDGSFKPASIHGWIIETPFPGHSQTCTYLDDKGLERAHYCDNMLAIDYIKSNPKFKIISDSEFTQVLNYWEQSQVTKPTETTEEHFNEMLGCLPPDRWEKCHGGSRFAMSEHSFGIMTQWFFHKHDKYYSFTGSAYMKDSELNSIIDSV